VTATDIPARVTAALAELGDTCDAVADRLRALEIKGWRGSESMCPIAVYLARIDKTWVAGVIEHEVYITTGDETTEPDEVPLPEPVSEFVQRFDKGVYLDLADGAVA
jgi:hypothetical protein